MHRPWVYTSLSSSEHIAIQTQILRLETLVTLILLPFRISAKAVAFEYTCTLTPSTFICPHGHG